MSPERRPKPGAQTARVLMLLMGGIESNKEISVRTGLSSTQISRAKRHLYDQNFFLRPARGQERVVKTPLKGRNNYEARIRISQAKGGVWASIEKYARWGMLQGEIEAVLKEKNISLSRRQIFNARAKAKLRGELPYLGDKQWRELYREKQTPEEKLQERVKLWLEVAELLAQNELEKIPQEREDWLLLIDFFQARKVYQKSANGGQEAINRFNQVLDTLPDEKVTQLKPVLEVIRNETSTTHRINQERVMKKAGAIPSELSISDITNRLV